jgi:hypothetical protein
MNSHEGRRYSTMCLECKYNKNGDRFYYCRYKCDDSFEKYLYRLQHKSNNHWVDAAMPYGSTWNISESGKILVGRLSKRSDA